MGTGNWLGGEVSWFPSTGMTGTPGNSCSSCVKTVLVILSIYSILGVDQCGALSPVQSMRSGYGWIFFIACRAESASTRGESQ